MLSAFTRRRGMLEIPLFPRAALLRHRCSFLALRQIGTECVKDARVTGKSSREVTRIASQPVPGKKF